MGQVINKIALQKFSHLIPFNGAYYTKNGDIRNLDGASGPGSNNSKLMPFTGVFIGSDGNPHDIDEIFAKLGGLVEGLRNKPTLLRADPNKYQVSKVLIVEAGGGYTVGDILTLVSNGENLEVNVIAVGTEGQITDIGFEYLISDVDLTSTEIIFATGGTGNGGGFKIETAYAHGDVTIRGVLGSVPDSDPLVQYSMLVSYISERLNSLFPVDTDDIEDEAVTAAKIDGSAIVAGDGIQVTKDDEGIHIAALAPDYQGIAITFINKDQNGDPI